MMSTVFVANRFKLMAWRVCEKKTSKDVFFWVFYTNIASVIVWTIFFSNNVANFVATQILLKLNMFVLSVPVVQYSQCWKYFYRLILFRLPCSGWFFLQTNFDFSTIHFWRFFFVSRKVVVLSLNLERCFTCDHFCYNYGVLKNAILASLRY